MSEMQPDVVTVVATRANGGTTVLRIVENEYVVDPNTRERIVTKHHDITPEYIEGIIAKYGWTDGMEVVDWEIVPNDYVDENTDRAFRNAWVHKKGNKKPDHDMPKAREIHRVYLRKARLAEFCRLDIEYAQADEAGDQNKKRELGAIRQKFRDVTEDPRIEAAQTVEDLRAMKLEDLVPETQGIKKMDKMRVSPAIPGVANG